MKHPRTLIAAALFAIALVVAFLLPGDRVLGSSTEEIVGQFIPWRAFAADSLRHGHLPLWNPYTFAGQPFLGGFQSALFYPPNLAFVALPLERALNFSVLLHLAILALGVAEWARRRGTHPIAAALAGFTAAGSGVVFPHVFAGHLSNLCTMAWVPWAFAGLETWWRERRASGLLLAAAAIALQILAGQLQYVFFFGVAAGVHALVVTGFEAASRRRALPAVALVCVAAALLAAAQLLPGLEAGRESVRQGALDYRFASAFALPPENLLTALAPGFFGEIGSATHPYWGRAYPWEMSVFLGVSSLVFVAMALRDADRKRQARFDLLVAGVLLVLALGRHLPLYRVLYDYVPGFGQFRGMSKFTFFAVLFALHPAATGIDGLIRRRWGTTREAVVLIGCGAFVGSAALLVAQKPEWITELGAWIQRHGNDDLIAPPKYPPGAAAHAAASLARAAAMCWLVAAGIGLGALRPAFRWIAIAVLPVEVVLFAAKFSVTTTVAQAMPAEMRNFVAQHPGDYRVLNQLRPNSGYLLGAPDLWGNDPGVLRRYAEFMTFTQGGDPAKATQNVGFRSVHPLYPMLRLRYAFAPSPTGASIVEVRDPLPRALLVSRYRVLPERDAIFAAMNASDFNPRNEVILEREPVPRPAATENPGSVRVIAADNDALTLEADTPAPALLLITDLYASGWRAHALPGAAQAQYEITPANYILRAIPIGAGHHAIRLDYRPATLTTGIVISIAGWLGWIALFAFVARGRRKIPASA